MIRDKVDERSSSTIKFRLTTIVVIIICSGNFVRTAILKPNEGELAGDIYNHYSKRAAEEGQCRYNGSSYNSGDFVKTGEPCLNCTCTRSYLICYLRVCPQIPVPPPQGCIILHKRNVCCPQLVCSEDDNSVRVEDLLSRHSRPQDDAADETEDESNDADEEPINKQNDVTNVSLYSSSPSPPLSSSSKGCKVNGTIYAEGSAMLSSTQCEYCYCIKRKQHCVKPNCVLQLAGCTPIYRKHTCCPIKYNCTSLRNVTIISSSTSMTPSPITAITTKLPVTSLLTSTSSSSSSSTETNTPMVITTTVVPSIGYTDADVMITTSIQPDEDEITTRWQEEDSSANSSLISQDYTTNSDDSYETSSDVISTTTSIDNDLTTSGRVWTENIETTITSTVSPFITTTDTDENYWSTTVDKIVDNFISETIRDVTDIKTTVGKSSTTTTTTYSIEKQPNVDVFTTDQAIKSITTVDNDKPINTTTTYSIEKQPNVDVFTADQAVKSITTVDNDTSITAANFFAVTTTEDSIVENNSNNTESKYEDEQPVDNVAMETTSRKFYHEQFIVNKSIETPAISQTTSRQLLTDTTIVNDDSLHEISFQNDITDISSLSAADKRSDARINNSTFGGTTDFSDSKNYSTAERSSSTNSVVTASSPETVISNTTEIKIKDHAPDYELYYDEPTLPPSLPNLKIIPFVAADALDHPQDAEASSVEQSEEIDPLSVALEQPQVNQFSPPIETEGGFVPKEPTLDGPYFESKYVSLHQETSENLSTLQQNHDLHPPLVVTETADITKSGVCVTKDRLKYKHGELISEPKTCNICVCLHGQIVCQEPECPRIDDGCQRIKNDESCCGEIICDEISEEYLHEKRPSIKTNVASPAFDKKPSSSSSSSNDNGYDVANENIERTKTSESSSLKLPDTSFDKSDIVNFQLPTSWFPSDEKYLSQMEKIPSAVYHHRENSTNRTGVFNEKVIPNVPDAATGTTGGPNSSSVHQQHFTDTSVYYDTTDLNNTTTEDDDSSSSSEHQQPSDNDYDNGLSLENVLSFLFDESPTASSTSSTTKRSIDYKATKLTTTTSSAITRPFSFLPTITTTEQYESDDPMMETANSVHAIFSTPTERQRPSTVIPDRRPSDDNEEEPSNSIPEESETTLLHNPLLLLNKFPDIIRKPIDDNNHRYPSMPLYDNNDDLLLTNGTTKKKPPSVPGLTDGDKYDNNNDNNLTRLTYGNQYEDVNSIVTEAITTTTTTNNDNNNNNNAISTTDIINRNNSDYRVDNTILLSTDENNVRPTTIYRKKPGIVDNFLTTTTKATTKLKSPLISADPGAASGLLKLSACNIFGKMYKIGKIILELSGPCLQCMCTDVGVQCSPLQC